MNVIKLVSRLRGDGVFRATRGFSSETTIKTNYENISWPEPEIEDVKKQLRELEGGRVTLYKDETNGIAQLCIDHVEKKNSLSGKMMVEFHEAISTLEKWETGKGVLLFSKGDTFCSGGYLETVKALSAPEGGFRMSALMQDAVMRLRNLPLISVAVIHGQALGGGAELTLCTDFRLCTPKSEIGFVQARMGITTGWGGGLLLKKLVGHPKALDIMLTSRRLKLDEIKALGLVDGIVNPDGRLNESSQWLNSKVEHLPVSVVHAVKKNVLSSSFYEERQIFGGVWGGPSHLEKLAQNIKHN
ncbi:unnamed protein product [Allacma fusca]|uniref:Ethylmalonyl-CoA decarboxylase n=1 Tax=Allacma fusca TaxID=39272 RepID=A0A8J2LTA9_9HEXA|nr:unnamed protein product [Allacma fusca]